MSLPVAYANAVADALAPAGVTIDSLPLHGEVVHQLLRGGRLMALTGGEVRLERSHDGRVAEVTLSHGRYTVITWEMRQLMAERFAEIDRDHDVRVVVIRSDGEHFSSGGDIAGFMEVDPVDFTDLGHNVTAAGAQHRSR